MIYETPETIFDWLSAGYNYESATYYPGSMNFELRFTAPSGRLIRPKTINHCDLTDEMRQRFGLYADMCHSAEDWLDCIVGEDGLTAAEDGLITRGEAHQLEASIITNPLDVLRCANTPGK
jgi:hypothetical protein